MIQTQMYISMHQHTVETIKELLDKLSIVFHYLHSWVYSQSEAREKKMALQDWLFDKWQPILFHLALVLAVSAS